MPQWPIRVKLIAGLSLVVGMMLLLMGGSIFGLHAFNATNQTLADQLRELGASKELLQQVIRLEGMRSNSPEERRLLKRKVEEARRALDTYYNELKKNTARGKRADDGRDELKLAFLIDDDLTAVLAELDPRHAVEPILPGTMLYLERHPEMQRPEPARDGGPAPVLGLRDRIERLSSRAVELPDVLHQDFWQVLVQSQKQFHSCRLIVWTAAVTVLAMLCGLAALFHRWVLFPIRLLHRGVRRVGRGSFDSSIELHTGDEMQSLAEAFNDMTARLRVMYDDLERQVQERSRQLVRSERLAGVGFLAAGVAHEINNPLASIAFCAEALENRLASLLNDPEKPDAKLVRDYLRMLQEEAFRCKRITEKLLDFSRCGEIQRQPTELGELVSGVVEMVQHMGKYRAKQIAFHPRQPVFAHADSQEIKQVVLNLVVNALDSMEEGGTLRIDLGYAEGMAELVFADDGCGMAPEVLENIFEPFFTKRRVGKGTGLGLSITHRIVSQHQGEITASSPGEGCGATFVVRLPVRPTEAVEPDGDEPAAATAAGSSEGSRAA